MNTTKIPSYIFTVKATCEQVKVRTLRPEKVHIISYNSLISHSIYELEEAIYTKYITDEMIKNAIIDNRKVYLKENFWLTIKKHNIDHAIIIANLVKLIPKYGCVPLVYDNGIYSYEDITPFPFNGSHRLRSLRYLNRQKNDFIIPFNLYGDKSQFERLLTPLECEFKPC